MTLTQLRQSARVKADETETGFIDDAALNRFLNQGLRLIYGKIVQAFESHFVREGTTGNGGKFNTVAGVSSYNLPTDTLKILRVESRAVNSASENDWRKLPPTNIASDQGNDDYYPVREGYNNRFGGYFLTGSKVYVRPVPTQAFSIRIWDIPRVTAMVIDADVPGIGEEYHELIAEYGAIQMLRASGEAIWRESMELFTIELQNMLETVEGRDQQAEQMVISDLEDYPYV